MTSPTSNRPIARIAIAVVAAFSLLAVIGSIAPPAQAQGAAQFVFEGAGWGHGVGMSQNGARNAADGGVDHVGILNFYYPNTIVTPTAPLDNIRVHIGDASLVEMSSEGSIVFARGNVAINAIPSGSITVTAHDGGLQIGNAWTTATPADPLYVSFPQPMKISNNGHRYLWGRIQLTVKNGKVRVVEVLSLEEYVQGIAEMPAAWPLEALKAQAIAARTYAHEVTLHRRNSSEWAQEYDISGSTVDQNYIGYDAQDSAWDQKWLAAVAATTGVEIVGNEGPIRSYYSASNGGYTETASYVFSNDVPYTVAGPDPYDEGGHDWTTWTRTYTQSAMSRWLNKYDDTSVGTLTAINVLGGQGASARLDKAVVELVGTSGTKRVTGKRLMLVMNSSIFAEGGGLSTHLPGTFTTVGNGAGAGSPVPSGAAVAAQATPDPTSEAIDENAAFTAPPGWQPEPGTGVPPGNAVAPTGDAETPANAGVEDSATTASTFSPPAGWAPEPGTGVPPGEGVAPGTANDDSAAAGVSAASTFIPPDGWAPEVGTGVPPGTPVPPGGAVPPGDPVPAGGGVPPGTPVPPGGAIPPGDPVPAGGGVPPGDPVPPVATAAPAGDGVPPGGPVPPVATAAPASTSTASSAPSTTESASGAAAVPARFVPPQGWTPAAGTGVAPGSATNSNDFVGGTGGGGAAAGGVLLVTRTASGTELTETKFEVIAPTSDLAAQARGRLEDLQAKAALGLFADVDIDGYIASVAPRPIHAVCTATATGITCLPIEALKASD